MAGVMEELRELGLDEQTLKLIEGELADEGEGQSVEMAEEQEQEPATATTTAESEAEAGGAGAEGERGGAGELEPVIGKREEQESGGGKGAEEASADAGRLIQILKQMTPEERAQWAAREGYPAILALMELQKAELQEQLQQVVERQKEEVLQAVVEEWAEQHKDLLEDPVLSVVAEGVDMALLKRAGYQSWKELSPAQLKRHLDQVAEIVKGLVGQGQGQGGGGQKIEEKEVGNEEKATTVGHVGDLVGGSAGGGRSGAALSPEAILEADPLVLEEKIGSLGEEQIAQLLRSLEEQTRR